jgi:hypothetical protein
MFGPLLWVAFEAKTETGGEIPAKYAGEAGSHINYAEASTSGTAPPASFAVMINPRKPSTTPQRRSPAPGCTW